MSIDTIRTSPVEEESRRLATATDQSSQSPSRGSESSQSVARVLEVSAVDACEVTAYARTVDDADVYLERKGGRTFLVAD